MPHSYTPSQATDIVNAVLEGYPKSKKELMVSVCTYVCMLWNLLDQKMEPSHTQNSVLCRKAVVRFKMQAT